MKVSFFDKLTSGDIYEVPLFKSYGFCYVKLIKHELVFNDVVIIKILVKPLNRYEKSKPSDIKNFKLVDDYVFSPILLLGAPKLRGENSWRFISNISLNEYDIVVPDFKITYEINDLFNSLKNFSDLQWYKVKQLNASGSIKSKYNDIKDLGFFSELNYLMIIYKLTILWIFKNGDNVEDYISTDESKHILGFDIAYQLASLELPSNP